MRAIKEYFELIWLNLVVKKRNLIEYLKVICRYYSNRSFLRADLCLLSLYFFKNPYKISKHYLLKKGEKEVDAYGETPLTTLEYIVQECELSAQDLVFELGSGRGRGCFWLHTFVGCKVVGVEMIPEFVKMANQVKQWCQLTNIEFRQEDILSTDLKGATVLYLYGTCYENFFIKKLIKRFSKLPEGTKIITVSYPLTDYMDYPDFELVKHFSVPFTWGMGEVYLQIKKKN